MSPLVSRLITEHGVPQVDASGPPESPGLTALFIPGKASESADVAVILPELLKAFAGRLDAAVAAPEAEGALAARFAVFVTPALVFLRDGQAVATVTKVRDWSDYGATVRSLLQEDAPCSKA